MLHAIGHHLVVDDVGVDPDRWLVVGPDRAANLLDVVVLVTTEGDELIIDAMTLRSVDRKVPRTMTKRTHGHTSSGTPIDDGLVDELATEAERGDDTDEIVARRGTRGRPPLGTAPSTVESVQLDPELEERLARRARDEGVPVSEVIRDARRHHLETS